MEKTKCTTHGHTHTQTRTHGMSNFDQGWDSVSLDIILLKIKQINPNMKFLLNGIVKIKA